MNVYWLEQNQAVVPPENDWLSVREVLQLSGMRFAKRRADWRLGRWTAKNAVARYLQDRIRSLAEIEIRSAPSGVPEVFLTDNPTAVTISLSHRDGIAVCAVAPCKVALGCDLEIIEPHSDAFLTDYFTADEQALVACGPNGDLLTTLLWSAKESALKALSVGLRLNTRCVVVRPHDALGEATAWQSLQVRHSSGRVFHGWWQQTGEVVRTLVSDPASPPPIVLVSRLEKTAGASHRESAAVLLP
jgi:4'-phosphopantetheinyl transferase